MWDEKYICTNDYYTSDGTYTIQVKLWLTEDKLKEWNGHLKERIPKVQAIPHRTWGYKKYECANNDLEVFKKRNKRIDIYCGGDYYSVFYEKTIKSGYIEYNQHKVDFSKALANIDTKKNGYWGLKLEIW